MHDDATSGRARQEDTGAWGDPRAPGARTSEYARSTAAVRVTPDTRREKGRKREKEVLAGRAQLEATRPPA